MKTWRSASLAVMAAAVLALTTACGQGGAEPSASGQNVGAAAPAGDGAGAASASSDGAGNGYGSGVDTAGTGRTKPAGQLAVRSDAKLGDLLTDSAGFTLYRFDKDTAKPSKSSCAGACATAWPPVPADGARAAAGIDASLLGTVTRADGTEQLTVAGWPVYRFAKDEKAGDTKGQGVGGTWFAAAPDGAKARPAERPGLSTRVDRRLGEIVVDGNGRTVYRFTKDSAWPMKSACTGACLEKWPVVAPVAKADTSGILLKRYVTFDRPDGVEQQTIDCWPLYTFAGDKDAGDTNGQGVGGTWFAVRPDGKLVKQ
ncbi:SCO0930 family lipoprotein [Streptomyces sp. NPDC059578]|uniref:SCO0930 family lipoprotein n=1 Tax=Streptomyces sp. NPDC059578 TaxID=3346874 RepID=UPI00368D4336